MSDQVHGPQGNALRQEEAAVDEYVRSHFGVEPPDDTSGLLTGESGPRSGEPDENEQFAAYMARHFGQHR